MTTSPEVLTPVENKPKRVSILEDLFQLGYARSQPKKVYYDPQTEIEIVVQYRTLTPVEVREIFELVHSFQDPVAQMLTEKMETVARAVVAINNMPLILDTKDREDFQKKHGREPTILDQARVIILEKIKSIHVIELLYADYQNFLVEVKNHFDDVKKKLNLQNSSS